MRRTIGIILVALSLYGGSLPAIAQEKKTATLPVEYVNQMKWRNIGPANMSGRITSIAVYEKEPTTWWASSASGGLLKTVNNGVTFEFQFDDQPTVSIGDVQVAQSDPNIVWVGTGEANPRNSVSWGDGVYKSTDGGKTWKNMGLGKTFQIGRIAIHPENPDIVYVGALGRLWGPNEERGLYKTTDGGKTWKKILYVDDKTGVIDVQMDLSNPERLYVATYERKRDGFDGNDPEVKYGAGSAIYRTNDGGKTFQKLTQGLPTCKLGRIGLSIYRKDSKYVYAIVESEKIGQMPDDLAFAGLTGNSAQGVGVNITAVTKDGPSEKGGLKVGDIVVSANGEIVHNYNDLLKTIRNAKVGEEVKLVCSRDNQSVDVTIKMGKRPEAKEESEESGSSGQRRRQQSSRNEFTGTLGGQAANRQDLQGPNGHEYGGIYRSDNYGETWVRINSLNPRPMYYSQIRVDPSDNQHVFVCGTALWRSSDGGTTFSNDGGSDGIHVDHHALWIDPRDGRHQILGNDGGIHVTYDRMTHWDHLAHVAIGQFYHVGISHDLDYRVYGGLQDNGSWGGPTRSPNGPIVNSDWIRVGGGDGFICLVDPEDPNQIYSESQNGAMGRLNLETGERGFIRPRPPRGQRYRFNWKTPFILSPHNSKIHYSAGNYVFRSPYKGDKIKAISPEITNTDRGAGSAISESGVEEGVLFVGTTDGALWATRDGGNKWVNLFTEPDQINAPAEKPDAKNEDEKGDDKQESESDDPESGETDPATQSGSESDEEPTRSASDRPRRERGGSGRGGSGRGRLREMLLSRDANKDGKISRDELPDQMRQLIGRLDSNEDGLIDQQELEALGTRGGRTETPAEPSDQRPEPPGPEASRQSATDESAAKGDETKSQEPAADKPADPVTGTWKGRFVNAQFPGEFTLNLKLQDGQITGSYESDRANGSISGGKLDGQKITMTGATGAELKFDATLSGKSMKGTLDVNDGQFTIEFEAQKQDAATAQKAAPKAGSPIKDLVPGPRWVSSLEASKFKAGRCYLTLDGHRSNDDEVYVFKTEDYGQTWTSLKANLPTSAGPARVIREDVINENLLFLGCEFSCWVSIDRGASWTRLNSNLPTVAVHEIAIHPTRGEIVAATHGRSLWIMNVTGLRQLSAESLAAPAKLYQPGDIINWSSAPSRGDSGTRRFRGENPPSGTEIYYSLGQDARNVNLSITNLQRETIFSADGISGSASSDNNDPVIENGTRKGLHSITWNGTINSRSQSGRRFRRRAPTGDYLVTLTVDGNTFQQTLSIKNDPTVPPTATTEEEYELMKAMQGIEEEESGSDEPLTSRID